MFFVSGGFGNKLLLFKNISKSVTTEPDQLIIRLFGGNLSADAMSAFKNLGESGEVLLRYHLSKHKFGPKLLGVFKGGLLEEFVPSHTATNEDFSNEQIRFEIARNFARYHSLGLPVSKKPVTMTGEMVNKFEGFLKNKETLRTEFKKCQVEKGLEDVDIDALLDYDYQSEVKWILETELKVKGREVFTLKDVNRGNVLIRDTPNERDERVMLIDYDFSGIGPRGLDIGGHFKAHCDDSSNDDFRSGLDFPSEEWQQDFAREYLRELKNIGKLDIDEDGLDSVHQILMEANFYTMVWSLFCDFMTMADNGFAIHARLPFIVS